MAAQQRQELDTLLRTAPRQPDPTVEEQRAGFAFGVGRPAAEDITVTRTVLGGRPALELAHRSASGGARLLYLHGGGYLVGSPDTHAGLVGELARRTGIRAVSLDYRLAPEHLFPA